MEAEKALTVVLFIVCSAVLTIIAVPMMQGKVQPNWWYGVRTPKTLKNPQTWYAINTYAGKGLFVAGILSLFVSVGTALLPNWSAVDYVSITGTVLLVIISAVMIMTFVKLRSL
ncbi:MAG: SdpI family protein [Anaerolineae bacterium]|nr:SdpI family protein [Anaerolineae bacterium]